VNSVDPWVIDSIRSDRFHSADWRLIMEVT
jgi:hypothetical protein